MLLGTAALAASVLRPAFTAQAPGAFGSPAWRNAAHEHLEETDAYVLEDRDAVYVAFAANVSQSDPDDAVRLYLWSDKTAYAFVVDSRGTRSAWCSAGSQALPHWTAREQAEKDGYTVTMRFPREFFSGPQSRWLAQFARVLPQQHVGYTWPESTGGVGEVTYSAQFDSSAGQFSTAALKTSPTVTAAGAKGVAVSQTTDNVALTAMAAQTGDGSQETSASLAWSSPDDRVSAGLRREANAAPNGTSVSQSLSLGYDNGHSVRVWAGLAAQDGSGVTDLRQATSDSYDFSLYGNNGSLDMRWNAAGPQFDPSGDGAPAAGTSGYTLSATRAFGNVSLDAQANRYHDDLGNLFSANESAAITAALSPALVFDVSAAANAATSYTALPYLQDTAGFRYGKDGRQASVSLHQERSQNGTSLASMSGAFTLPLLRRSTVSLGYQNTAGAADVSFSFEDHLPIGLLRATYYNAGVGFSAPGVSIKFVRL